MSPYIKHTFLYFLGKGIPGLFSFISILIYTRIITPEQYGRYGLVISAVGIVNILGFQWFRQGIARFFAEYDKSKQIRILRQLVNANFYAYSLVGFMVAMVGFILRFFYEGFWIEVIPVVALLAISLAGFELVSQLFISSLKPIAFSVSNILRSSLTLFFSVVLLLAGFGYWALFIGVFIGQAVATTFGFWRMKLVEKPVFHRKEIKEILVYSFPLTITAGLNFILGYLDRFILQFYAGTVDTGFFTFGYDFSEQTVGVIMAIAATSTLPIGMRIFAERGNSPELQKHMKQALWIFLVIALPFCCLLIGLAPDYTSLLFGSKFSDIHPLLIPVIASSILILGIKSYYLDQVFYFFKATKIQIIIVGFAALLNVVFNVLLIPRYGYIGAAYATFISYSGATVLTFFYVRKYMNVPFAVWQIMKLLFCTLLVYFALWMMPHAENLVSLILKTAFAVFIFVLLIMLTDYKQIKQLIQK